MPAKAMRTVIVYVDDAAHARQALGPLAATPTHWVLVACAPRMTHRISKWVSHSARENWRIKWADKLFAQMHPWLAATGARVSTVIAKAPLPELLAELQTTHGFDATVVDARRPKQEQTQGPVQPAPMPTAVTRKPPRRWSGPGSLTGLGLLFMLAVAAD